MAVRGGRRKGSTMSSLRELLFAVRFYRAAHRELPRLRDPRTFNEKVLHRILFDRRPVLTQMADKVACRSYVEARLGAGILPAVYHVTDNPRTLPLDELPGRFVVKATHGSGWVQVVEDKATLDRAALTRVCDSWLSQNYYQKTREWAYKDIPPRLMVEEFIDDGSGGVPRDYKLFVFDGTVAMIQVDANRFSGHRRRLYSPAWEQLPVLLSYDDIEGDVARPPHLTPMIAAAQALGEDMDFVRADFYDTPERIYFGELTTTPECAMGSFRPKEYDLHLGQWWKLPWPPLPEPRPPQAGATPG
jgi:hypothetical protein